jgi:integrase
MKETTRHGAVAWYFRKGKGERVRLKGEYGSPEFWASYHAALAGAPVEPKRVAGAHTLEWALNLYRRSSAWAALSTATRRQRENIFKRIIATAGNEPLAGITRKTIIAGRERRAATPHAANVYLKAMRSFYAWACGDGALVTEDPTKGVSLLKGANDDIGFHTWTEEEMARFEERWPLGNRERLAFDLLLYTGLRRGDAVRVGRQHVRDGVIHIKAEKTGEDLFLPILPPLAASIAAAPTGDLAFIIGADGKPFVKESFGNWFRDACRAAKCPGAAHGLRKAGAVRAAEGGASDKELMALFGWTSGKMAALYTRAADRKRLSLAAAERLVNTKRPHPVSGAGAASKKS